MQTTRATLNSERLVVVVVVVVVCGVGCVCGVWCVVRGGWSWVVGGGGGADCVLHESV